MGCTGAMHHYGHNLIDGDVRQRIPLWADAITYAATLGRGEAPLAGLALGMIPNGLTCAYGMLPGSSGPIILPNSSTM